MPDLTPNFDPGRVAIASGWLVYDVGYHTCGGYGPESGYAHEPGCGAEPMCEVADIPDLLAAAAERDALAAAVERVRALLRPRLRQMQSPSRLPQMNPPLPRLPHRLPLRLLQSPLNLPSLRLRQNLLSLPSLRPRQNLRPRPSLRQLPQLPPRRKTTRAPLPSALTMSASTIS